ncbi:acyltransferase family protein [Azonexus sp.]|uniref:acyltransferase family protein n=1 Tax=Azonexus sp. TaxID=1872668 RepID=UPI0035B2AE95
MQNPSSHQAFRHPAMAGRARLSLIVALRALASLVIVLHHFSLYPPLSEWAAPLLGTALDWLATNARATQVFFVVGGYVMARSMSGRQWDGPAFRRFLGERYLRLGLPYLAVISIVLPVCLFARGQVPDAVLGQTVTLPQLLAHFLFLQDILGYEPLSAGLWFVCINFQLGALYAGLLWLRDRVGRDDLDFAVLGGWGLSALSLFHVNLDNAWDIWAIYFFPYFFLGVVVYRAQRADGGGTEFWLFQLLLLVAMLDEWRWRLGIAQLVGLLLFAGDRTGFMTAWPRSRLLGWLGRISYSLFLVHFPVLLLVSTVWASYGWQTPLAASFGLLVALCLSIVAAAGFHRWVEMPAARLARRRSRGQSEPDPAWAN